ncbi:MAG: hypothetical protein WC294_08320 [Methanoregula sp.]|jgi:hypothetical protein
MPEIYVRERDKQDAKIREFEKRFKAIEDDNRVLRQRLAVIEDKFRPEPIPDETITILNAPKGTPISSSDLVFYPEKKTRKPRKVAA